MFQWIGQHGVSRLGDLSCLNDLVSLRCINALYGLVCFNGLGGLGRFIMDWVVLVSMKYVVRCVLVDYVV